MVRVIVRATEILPAGTYTYLPGEKRIEVEMNTWADVIAAVIRAGCDPNKVYVTAIDQPDCTVKDGTAVSPMFENFRGTLP